MLLRFVVDDVLARLPAGHRDIVQFRLEGFEVTEIAKQTGKSMRTTERVLQEFRNRMAAHVKDESVEE